MWDVVPPPGSNLYHLPWEHGVLTTGLPEKSIYLLLSCVEGKYSIYCKVSKKASRLLMLKRPQFLNGFLGGFFLS